ncbi:MAG TPA: hypothetical protein VJ840_04400 [Gemmatimonadaceae bacterium]|nr:hypothetical protein [Gemmatimonadaceae bacterium]
MLRKFVFVITAIALTACASAGGAKVPRRDYNVITQSEITSQNGTNAWDVVSHLRPNYLKTRGRTSIQNQTVASEYASVFVDSQFYGDLNSLRTIATINIKEIRYLPANEAVTRYGMQYGNGVIEVVTR